MDEIGRPTLSTGYGSGLDDCAFLTQRSLAGVENAQNAQSLLGIRNRPLASGNTVEKMATFSVQWFTPIQGHYVGVGLDRRRHLVLPFDTMGVKNKLIVGCIIEDSHFIRADDDETLLFHGMQPANKYVRLHATWKAKLSLQ